jgi:hypothetical protein
MKSDPGDERRSDAANVIGVKRAMQSFLPDLTITGVGGYEAGTARRNALIAAAACYNAKYVAQCPGIGVNSAVPIVFFDTNYHISFY